MAILYVYAWFIFTVTIYYNNFCFFFFFFFNITNFIKSINYICWCDKMQIQQLKTPRMPIKYGVSFIFCVALLLLLLIHRLLSFFVSLFLCCFKLQMLKSTVRSNNAYDYSWKFFFFVCIQILVWFYTRKCVCVFSSSSSSSSHF